LLLLFGVPRRPRRIIPRNIGMPSEPPPIAREQPRSDLHWLSASEGQAFIARGALDPVAWTEALIERIGRLASRVQAFIHVDRALSLRQAQAARQTILAGHGAALTGVPLAIKDVIDTCDMPTTGHSRSAIDRRPDADAHCVALLRKAGVVIVGKTATHEFAHGGPSLDLPWPPARNPWNPDHFTGSSSSGSGAAVAAGLSPFALGTDTGGSIRIPAAMCGVTGLKPTYGRVSRRGVLPLAGSLDTVGPIARSARDCALLLQSIAGHDPGDPSSVDRPVADYLREIDGGLKGLRIGVIRHFWEEDLKAHPDARVAMENALSVLRAEGAILSDLRLTPLGLYNDVRVLVQEPEAFARYLPDLRRRAGLFGRDFLGRILPGCLVPGYIHFEASRVRERLSAQMREAFADVDLMVTLGPGPAPRLDAARTHGFLYGLWSDRPNITSPFSVTGLPALSVCTGLSSGGLPLSMQIVGRPFDEATVLRAGAAFESATDAASRRPPVDQLPEPQPIRLAPDEPAPILEPSVAGWVERSIDDAGLQLTDGERALVHAAAPNVRAMMARLAFELDRSAEPAAIFRA
jgi:aspartyl-tRNA(Asn)/glutamyl-tRNA(Gln) amidotransferase subunit A